MCEKQFKALIKNELNIEVECLEDSVFRDLYNLSEADFLYFLFALISVCDFNEEKIKALITKEEIRFSDIFEIVT